MAKQAASFDRAAIHAELRLLRQAIVRLNDCCLCSLLTRTRFRKGLRVVSRRAEAALHLLEEVTK